ncbi:MAG: FMN-binding negative transcriptional regulator [Pseudomonadota bacterium]
MHPNPVFRGEETARHLEFARSRAFGTLAVNADPTPLLAHIPFLLDASGASADLHLVRSNPIARLGGATPAVISVTGPDGYVSPDWYGVADQVPTWNYVAVHLRGQLEPLPHETMRDMLDRQSAHFEDQLTPKTPWTTGKMTPEVLDRMMRQILPFRLRIDSVDGTWKLSQNKDASARKGAADAMTAGQGSNLASLAQLMREV